MNLKQIFLWLTALVFAAFGVWGALSPDAMVANFDMSLPTGDSKTMIRASYGGFLIGEAAVIGYCALAAERVRLGLVVVVLLTAPILATRLFGFAIDGSSSSLHLSYAAIEASGILIAVLFLMRSKRA